MAIKVIRKDSKMCWPKIISKKTWDYLKYRTNDLQNEKELWKKRSADLYASERKLKKENEELARIVFTLYDALKKSSDLDDELRDMKNYNMEELRRYLENIESDVMDAIDKYRDSVSLLNRFILRFNKHTGVYSELDWEIKRLKKEKGDIRWESKKNSTK